MSYRDPKAALRALYDVATTQGGYFTAKQAASVGYGKRHLDYHAKAGNFERRSTGSATYSADLAAAVTAPRERPRTGTQAEARHSRKTRAIHKISPVSQI